jgi:hypothetical protein
MIDQPVLLDSRRLPGPSLLLERAGVVIDVSFPDGTAGPLITRWLALAQGLLADLDIPPQAFGFFRYPGGASLAHTAPLDLLLAATEINEWAWAASVAEQGGPPAEARDAAIVRIRAQVEAERNPSLLALVQAANSHQVNVLADDEEVSIGSGVGSMTWSRGQVPPVAAVDWSSIADVPIALVTGSNGKTTTVRLLAAMSTAAGYLTGHTSTDGVVAGSDLLAGGDYAGPEGARLVLRDRRVEAAVLETARGGMLRRGLAVTRAQVAVITNVAPDHLGEFG